MDNQLKILLAKCALLGVFITVITFIALSVAFAHEDTNIENYNDRIVRTAPKQSPYLLALYQLCTLKNGVLLIRSYKLSYEGQHFDTRIICLK